MKLSMLTVLIIALLSTLTDAGEFNEVKTYLDPAPAWTKLPGVDGRQYSLTDFKEQDVLVVAFTCNSCPYAVDYEDRLIALAQKYQKSDQKVSVVAINVNLVEEDSLEAMTQRAKEKRFPFAYLFDESQMIAKEFGASRTPEFFVLNKDRKIVYMGAFDDNTKADQVTKHYVEDAVESALQREKPDVVETAPVGCAIRILSERQKQRLKMKQERDAK